MELSLHDYLISCGPMIIKSTTQNIIDLTKRSRKLSLEHEMSRKGAKQGIEDDIYVHINIIDAVLEKDVKLAQYYVEKDFEETMEQLFSMMDKIP